MNILFLKDDTYLRDIVLATKDLEDKTVIIIGNSQNEDLKQFITPKSIPFINTLAGLEPIKDIKLSIKEVKRSNQPWKKPWKR